MNEPCEEQEFADQNSASVSCEDCVHCVIVEDRSEMRRPSAYCILKIPMKEIDCMEWVPIGGYCPQFIAGDAEYL